MAPLFRQHIQKQHLLTHVSKSVNSLQADRHVYAVTQLKGPVSNIYWNLLAQNGLECVFLVR